MAKASFLRGCEVTKRRSTRQIPFTDIFGWALPKGDRFGPAIGSIGEIVLWSLAEGTESIQNRRHDSRGWL